MENGMDAWALTEHGHMNSFGHAYLHAEKLRKAGANFKFIPGCEMYLHPDLRVWDIDHKMARAAREGDESASRKLRAQRDEIVTPLTALVDADDDPVDVVVERGDDGLTIENEDETKSARSGKFYDPVKRRHHIVVLPKTSEGLERLFRLVSRGYKEGFFRFPRIDYGMLREAANGGHLLVSSACLTGDVELVTDQGLQCLDEVVRRVQDGDEPMVLSYDEKNDQRVFKRVTWGDLTRKDAKLLRIRTADGKSITCTPDHKVYTNEGWLRADELKSRPGVKILSI